METLAPTTYQSLAPRTDERPNHTLVISDNYAIRPNLLNEARFGITSADQSFTTGVRGVDIISQLGLTLLSTNPPDVTGTPAVQIAGYTNFGENQEEPLTQDNKSLRFTDKDNIEPRVGIAWRLGSDNRTVVRGGYGIYRARITY